MFPQQRVGPTRIVARHRWIGVELVVDIVVVAACAVARIDQGLNVEWNVVVGLTQWNLDDGQSFS
jgi:hypothetical protein